jgi:CheY-like chemotaxis protein
MVGDETAAAGAKVLVVDDDRAVRESMARILRVSGYEVQMAADGREALDQLARDPDVSCMILDMAMPGLNGVDVLTSLQEGPNVIVVSAFEYVSRTKVEEDFRDRVHAFLVKPVLPQVLLRTVAACTSE